MFLRFPDPIRLSKSWPSLVNRNRKKIRVRSNNELLTSLDEVMDVDMAGAGGTHGQLLLEAALHTSHLPPAEPQLQYPGPISLV